MNSRIGSWAGLILMAVLAASSVPMAQAAEPSRQGDSAGARESDRPEPKETGISVAVSVLRREVTDQRRRQPEGWPRSEANFAQDKNWTVPDEQVLRALQRRVHPNPAIDGYIKWQLLSFEPEMSELDENAARRIIASMPKLLSPPKPDLQKIRDSEGTKLVFGRQVSQLADLKPVVGTRVGAMDPELGVVSTGSGRPGFSNRRERDPEVRAEAKRTAIRRADYQLEQAQNSIDLANEPIRAYRDQLIEMMPTKGGLQLGAMLRDVRDRLEAGDPTYRDRLRRLVDASRVLATDDSIAPDRRRTLIEQARRLKKLQTEVIRSLTYDREAKLIARQEVLEAPEEEIDRLLEHLKGEPFER